MNEVTVKRRIGVLRSRAEIETLRPFWEDHSHCRDADLDFFLFIVDIFPNVDRPHVVVLYENEIPRALLVARLETGHVPVKLGYLSLPVPKLRILQIVHGGWLGDMSETNARLLVGSIMNALATGEADAASLHCLDLESPLVRHVCKLPHRWCANGRVSPQTHRVRDVSRPDGSRFASPSRNEQYKQRQRARSLARAFRQSRIEQFRTHADVDRLMRDAEIIAAKSYQRGLGVGFSKTPLVRSRLEFEARKGWLRGYILYLEDQPCAFWIGSLRNQVFLSDYLSFDEVHAKYSPGMYLILKVVEDLQNEPSDSPVQLIDFGIGDAPYKERLAHRHWDEATIYMFAPRTRPLMVNALRSSIGMMNGTAKRLLQSSSWLAGIKRRWRARLKQTEANAA